MKKKCTIFLSLLLLAALLMGCGSSGGTMTATADANSSAFSPAAEPATYESAAAYDGDGWMPDPSPQEKSPVGGTTPANVKMIYTASISLESTEFDAAADGLEALTAELGGWFESSRLDNNSRNYRRANYTIRIPAENFETFCSRVGDLCKVNSLNREKEDISERYYDNESRLSTQRTKLDRLQKLLAEAENMEDIITLETAISETELTIENLTGTLRKYDSLVNYSTVTVSLSEVYQLTQTEEPAIGFGARLTAAFRSGTRSFVTSMQDLALGFARGWAGWLIFIAIVVIAILLIVRGHRRRKGRNGETERASRPKRARRGKAKRDAAEAAETEPDKPESEEKS